MRTGTMAWVAGLLLILALAACTEQTWVTKDAGGDGIGDAADSHDGTDADAPPADADAEPELDVPPDVPVDVPPDLPPEAEVVTPPVLGQVGWFGGAVSTVQAGGGPQVIGGFGINGSGVHP
jgi:hypothetical protein